MAKNRFQTIFEILGKDLASPAFAKVRQGLGMMGRSSKGASAQLRNTGNAMQQYFLARDIAAGFMRLGKGILNAFSSATDSAGKFEYGLASVGAVTRATETELKGLERAAIQAGIKTQFSPTEAVQGLQSLATAGQTATQSTKTLVPVLDLAAGSMGQLGVSEAAEAVVGTLNSYSMGADKAAGVTDKLLRITQLTNFQTRDFSVGLSKAAAMGANFDQSLTDVLIGMGQLRNRNIDASTSATSLREAFRRLGSDAGAQQAVQKHGIKIFDETTNTMRSSLDIIQELNQATLDMGVAEKKALMTKVLGTRGQLAWNAVVGASVVVQRDGNEVTLKGAEAIEHLRNEMENSTGTAEEFRKKLLETYEGQKILLRGTMETLAIVTGKAFAGLLAPAVKILTDSLNKLIQIIDALPPSAKRMFAALTTGTGVVIALTGALVMVNVVMKMFGIRLRDIGWILLKTIAFMGPLTIMLGALGVGLYGIFRYFNRANEAGNNFAGIMDKVKVSFKAFIDLISTGGLSAATIKELDRIDSRGVRRFINIMDDWIKKAKAFFKGMVAGFDQGLSLLEGPINDLKRTIYSFFGDWIKGSKKGTDTLGIWKNKGESFGVMLAGLSAEVIKLTDSLLKVAIRIGEAFSGVTVDDMNKIVAAGGTMITIFTKIGNAIQRAMDFLTAWGTVGLSTEEMTRQQLLARVSLWEGVEAKGELKERFKLIDKMAETGMFGTKADVIAQRQRQRVEREYEAVGKAQETFVEESGQYVTVSAAETWGTTSEQMRKDIEFYAKRMEAAIEKQKFYARIELDGRELKQSIVRTDEDQNESWLGFDDQSIAQTD